MDWRTRLSAFWAKLPKSNPRVIFFTLLIVFIAMTSLISQGTFQDGLRNIFKADGSPGPGLTETPISTGTPCGSPSPDTTPTLGFETATVGTGTVTPTATVDPCPSVTATETASVTATVSATVSATTSPTVTATTSPTTSPTVTATVDLTATATASVTPGVTVTAGTTITPGVTITPGTTVTADASVTSDVGITPTPGVTDGGGGGGNETPDPAICELPKSEPELVRGFFTQQYELHYRHQMGLGDAMTWGGIVKDQQRYWLYARSQFFGVGTSDINDERYPSVDLTQNIRLRKGDGSTVKLNQPVTVNRPLYLDMYLHDGRPLITNGYDQRVSGWDGFSGIFPLGFDYFNFQYQNFNHPIYIGPNDPPVSFNPAPGCVQNPQVINLPNNGRTGPHWSNANPGARWDVWYHHYSGPILYEPRATSSQDPQPLRTWDNSNKQWVITPRSEGQMTITYQAYKSVGAPTSKFSWYFLTGSQDEPPYTTYAAIENPGYSFTFSPVVVGSGSNNQPPNPPSLTCSATGQINQPVSISLQGTDPDAADTLAFWLDYDYQAPPGFTDEERLPATGFVAQNTRVTTTHTWTTIGTKKIAALAEDNHEDRSTVVFCDIIISASTPPPSSVDLKIIDPKTNLPSDGPVLLDDFPASGPHNRVITAQWTVQNATNCEVYRQGSLQLWSSTWDDRDSVPDTITSSRIVITLSAGWPGGPGSFWISCQNANNFAATVSDRVDVVVSRLANSPSPTPTPSVTPSVTPTITPTIGATVTPPPGTVGLQLGILLPPALVAVPDQLKIETALFPNLLACVNSCIQGQYTVRTYLEHPVPDTSGDYYRITVDGLTKKTALLPPSSLFDRTKQLWADKVRPALKQVSLAEVAKAYTPPPATRLFMLKDKIIRPYSFKLTLKKPVAKSRVDALAGFLRTHPTYDRAFISPASSTGHCTVTALGNQMCLRTTVRLTGSDLANPLQTNTISRIVLDGSASGSNITFEGNVGALGQLTGFTFDNNKAIAVGGTINNLVGTSDQRKQEFLRDITQLQWPAISDRVAALFGQRSSGVVPALPRAGDFTWNLNADGNEPTSNVSTNFSTPPEGKLWHIGGSSTLAGVHFKGSGTVAVKDNLIIGNITCEPGTRLGIVAGGSITLKGTVGCGAYTALGGSLTLDRTIIALEEMTGIFVARDNIVLPRLGGSGGVSIHYDKIFAANPTVLFQELLRVIFDTSS